MEFLYLFFQVFILLDSLKFLSNQGIDNQLVSDVEGIRIHIVLI